MEDLIRQLEPNVLLFESKVRPSPSGGGRGADSFHASERPCLRRGPVAAAPRRVVFRLRLDHRIPGNAERERLDPVVDRLRLHSSIAIRSSSTVRW